MQGNDTLGVGPVVDSTQLPHGNCCDSIGLSSRGTLSKQVYLLAD